MSSGQNNDIRDKSMYKFGIKLWLSQNYKVTSQKLCLNIIAHTKLSNTLFFKCCDVTQAFILFLNPKRTGRDEIQPFSPCGFLNLYSKNFRQPLSLHILKLGMPKRRRKIWRKKCFTLQGRELALLPGHFFTPSSRLVGILPCIKKSSYIPWLEWYISLN